MAEVVKLIEAGLIPFLVASSLALGLLFVYVLVKHAADEVVLRYRRRLAARYRPLIDALLSSPARTEAIDRLRRSPWRHRAVIAGLLLTPLRVATGAVVDHVHAAAHALGLIDRWMLDLRNRHWWVRAEAARALGLVHAHAALDGLIARLDDDHEEVRAAAVEALGMAGGAQAIAALVGRLSDESRHQRARLVDALRRLGGPVTPALLAYVREHPDQAADLIQVLGLVGSLAVVDDLFVWCADSRPSVRASAMQALGSVGVDDRGYYYALRGLNDEHADVRAMAARALGRSRQAEAVTYLAEHLDDVWHVAAHAAAALRALGPPGLDALRSHGSEPGHTGELARQMVWEQEALSAAGAVR